MTGWVLILLRGEKVHAKLEIIVITHAGDLPDGEEKK